MPRRSPVGAGELLYQPIFLLHMLHSDTVRHFGSLSQARSGLVAKKNATVQAHFTHIFNVPRPTFWNFSCLRASNCLRLNGLNVYLHLEEKLLDTACYDSRQSKGQRRRICQESVGESECWAPIFCNL